MKILVVGCGSIGTRHLRMLNQLRSLGEDDLSLEAFDVMQERSERVRSLLDVPAHSSLEKALAQRPDGVIVATPNASHVPVAMEALKAGAHVFIEKPLSHSMEGVDELIRTADEGSRRIMIGYSLRHHDGLRKLRALLQDRRIGEVWGARIHFGQYLPDWHPNEDYRRHYGARRETGGGIILDASHEIDYAQWLFGAPVEMSCIARPGRVLEIETEEAAAITWRSDRGVLVEIHLDYLQRAYARGCEVYGEQGTIKWIFKEPGIAVYTKDTGEWTHVPCDPSVDLMYLRQMEAFVACLRGTAPPAVTVLEGKRVLEIALEARRRAGLD